MTRLTPNLVKIECVINAEVFYTDSFDAGIAIHLVLI